MNKTPFHHFCNNCGQHGHSYNHCPKPITSLGIITFKKTSNTVKYLLICRKDSLGYVEFVRGKYPLYNKEYIQNIIDEMTMQEKNNLLTKPFEQIWKDLWGNFYGLQYRAEEKSSKDKFLQIKEGIHLFDDTFFNLKSLIDNSKTEWEEPEWGFPKGRRNYQETDMQSAIREFTEETGFPKERISIVKNLVPFDEIFTGSNFKSYKHRYFLAHSNYNDTDKFQKSEVSKIAWMTLNEAISTIRPYNLERIDLLQNIGKMLHKYSLIS
jgi:ADP-ribose pyrophosphatase YjhB (NUDIX family)